MPGLRVCVDCHRLTKGIRCAEHQGEGVRTRGPYPTGSAASRGYDADWRRVREQVLLDEPFCRRCCLRNVKSLTLATDVDHIVPMSEGGSRLDRENLQPLCPQCHREKGNEDRFRRGEMG